LVGQLQLAGSESDLVDDEAAERGDADLRELSADQAAGAETEQEFVLDGILEEASEAAADPLLFLFGRTFLDVELLGRVGSFNRMHLRAGLGIVLVDEIGLGR